MEKLIDSHEKSIEGVLEKISGRYADKKHFLDVGCGDGTRTILFNRPGRIIFGVDFSNWLKNEIKKRIKFQQVDFNEKKLPYKNSSFDIVFSFDVIEHLPTPQPMLSEIYRVMKKNGTFIIGTPNRNRLLSFILLSLKLRKIPYFPNEATKGEPYASHVVEYTYQELEDLLKKKGFSVVRGHKIFHGITGWYGFTRLPFAPFFHNIILECVKL